METYSELAYCDISYLGGGMYFVRRFGMRDAMSTKNLYTGDIPPLIAQTLKKLWNTTQKAVEGIGSTQNIIVGMSLDGSRMPIGVDVNVWAVTEDMHYLNGYGSLRVGAGRKQLHDGKTLIPIYWRSGRSVDEDDMSPVPQRTMKSKGWDIFAVDFEFADEED